MSHLRAAVGPCTGDLTEAFAGVATGNVAVRAGTYLESDAVTIRAPYEMVFTPDLITSAAINISGHDDATSGNNSWDIVDAYLAFDFAIETVGDSEERIARVQSPLANVKIVLGITDARKLTIRDSANTLLDTGDTVLALDTVYRIALYIGTGAAADWELYIDGVLELSGTIDAQENAGFIQLGNGGSVAGSQFMFANIVCFDDDFPPLNTRVRVKIPIGAGANSGQLSGTFADVDDRPTADDSSVVISADNAKATFALQTSEDAGIVGSPIAVAPICIATSGAGDYCRPVLRSNGTDYVSASSYDWDETTPKSYKRYYDTNPNGGGAWSTAAVDLCEAGAQLDVQAASGLELFFTGLVVVYEFIEEVGGEDEDPTPQELASVTTLLQRVSPYPVTPRYAVINVNNTTGEVVAAATGKKIRVIGYTASMTAAGSAIFKSATTALTGTIPIATNGVVQGGYLPEGHFETAAGEALNLTVATGSLQGHLTYILIG